jgi:hypothetical protein
LPLLPRLRGTKLTISAPGMPATLLPVPMTGVIVPPGPMARRDPLPSEATKSVPLAKAAERLRREAEALGVLADARQQRRRAGIAHRIDVARSGRDAVRRKWLARLG